MPVNRRPDVEDFKGIAVYPGSEVSLQWSVSGSDIWQEVRFPIREAVKLLEHLQQAWSDGKLR